MNQDTYKVVMDENMLPSFCSDIVPQIWGFVFPAGQCSMPHSQVNQGVDGGPPDQYPVMASPISRPEPHWKFLDFNQEEDGSQAIKQSWAAFNVKDWWRACQDTWKLWLKIRVIPPNIDFWPRLKMNMNLFSSHYSRSDNASFLLFWPVAFSAKKCSKL